MKQIKRKQWKSQWHITICLLEDLKFKRQKKLRISSADVDVRQLELTHAGNEKWYSHIRKHFGNFFIMLNIHLLYDPAFPYLGIYSREMRTYSHIKTCIWILIATLFIITLQWTGCSCPGKSSHWNPNPQGDGIRKWSLGRGRQSPCEWD